MSNLRRSCQPQQGWLAAAGCWAVVQPTRKSGRLDQRIGRKDRYGGPTATTPTESMDNNDHPKPSHPNAESADIESAGDQSQPESIAPGLVIMKREASDRDRPRLFLSVRGMTQHEGQNRWYSVYVGTTDTVTQKRLDSAVATLHARRDLFLSADDDWEAADRAKALNVAEAPPQKRLLLDDVLAWNGVGERVVYHPDPSPKPTCPACGGPMVLRTNRLKGNSFWGCRDYPACRGTGAA